MKFLMLILLIILGNYQIALASPGENEIVKELFETLSTEQVNQFITNINHEMNSEIPLLEPNTIRKIITTGLSTNGQEIWKFVWGRLLSELVINIHLLGKLLFLAVLCAMLKNLQSSFENSNISLLSYSICYVFLAVIAINAFYNAVMLAGKTVGMMVGFMEALLPLMITLLTGIGAITSAAFFSPLMLFVVTSVSIVVKDVVLPLLLLTGMLDFVNHLSEKYRLNNLTNLIKQCGMVVLGLTLVVFIGIITIQGVAGGVADGLALRTAKFATATFVPVVGKIFADTVELVMGASLLMKNTIGIFGVITVALICILPLVKLLSLIFIIKIAGAVIQPMGDENMAKCLESMGNNLLLVFGALMTVALMFFLVITMIIGVGSIAVMLR